MEMWLIHHRLPKSLKATWLLQQRNHFLFLLIGLTARLNWSWDGGGYSASTSIQVNPTAHITYTANYSGVANPSPMNIHFTSSNGDYISLAWTKHPSSGVTQYQVWRKIKGKGESAVATLDSATTSFTDPLYIQNNNGGSLNMFYTVKAYYSPSNTWNDPGYYNVSGDFGGFDKNKNNFVSQEMVNEIPNEFKMENYPNPFNPTTIISYQLPKDGFVTLKVYDMIGREVATLVNEDKNAGYYKVNFDAARLTSGIYIYTINTNNFIQSKKMLLVK